MRICLVIATGDTKMAEIRFVEERFRALGHRARVLDCGLSEGYRSPFELDFGAVLSAVDLAREGLGPLVQSDLIDLAARGAAALAKDLVASGRVHGVMALGGLQNTTIGAAAVRDLPWGLPKLLVSTVASGQRTFEPLVGIGDVTVMPAVADL